ncbi:AraC family transcriptional regulator [Paraburkholderia humisilvae]|uniref:Transcriptional activator NphR n=1 Tax=Paraburkholderia humisilvae TaxID=627669 RepID=A0A6J5D8D8_9BURK|nr:AraC family transcriptional regulator [Paraburkholderia humisilvae]CAB3748996.1 Transcriptional activator NphR [Paraburkholderia humisilvae]
MQTHCIKSTGNSALDNLRWSDAMSNRFGLHCETNGAQASHGFVTQWRAGQLKVSDVQLAWQSVSPVMQRSPAWNGDYLLFKQVETGSLTIEQNGNTRHVDAGGVVLVDPARAFSEHFREATRLIVLRIPKKALRERGARYTLHDVHVPDRSSADVQAVRDYISVAARHAGTVSTRMLNRFGEQCLDFVDIVTGETPDIAEARRATLMLRARQTITRLIGDVDLDVAKIAEQLNVSANYLSRVFRAEGLTPMGYVWSRRLELAARLLAETPNGQLLSKEIAFRCGFSNASHFCRAFKRRYGVAPFAFAQHASNGASSAPSSLN